MIKKRIIKRRIVVGKLGTFSRYPPKPKNYRKNKTYPPPYLVWSYNQSSNLVLFLPPDIVIHNL